MLSYTMGLSLIGISLIMFIFLIYGLNKPTNKLKYIFLSLIFFSIAFTLAQGIAILINFTNMKQILIVSRIATYSFIYGIWFIFVLNFLKDERIQSFKYVLIVFAIPICLFFVCLTNIVTNAISVFAIGPISPFAYLSIAYALVLSITSAIFLLIPSKKTEHNSLTRFFLILLPFIPLIFSAFNKDFKMVHDFSPVGLLIMNIIAFYLIYYSKITDLTPYSRQNFIESIEVAMILLAPDGVLLDYNPAFQKIFPNVKCKTGMTFKEFCEDFEYNEIITNLRYSDKKQTVFYDSDNGLWMEITRTKVYENNEKLYVVYTFYDISKLKETENKLINTQNEMIEQSNRLAKANKEILVLIQEVHHRVKNNLMLILSFINLDKRYKTPPKEILDKSINRISSMALVYENTYESNYSSINLATFIRNSVKSLINLYSTDNINVEYDLDENITLTMDIVTPLSLILNELITNIFKYAFKDYEIENKKIIVKLKNSSNNKAYLIIQDNGKGLGEDIDIYNSPSLGLTIIKSLTNQIDGEFTKIDCEGAGFKIEFPLNTDA